MRLNWAALYSLAQSRPMVEGNELRPCAESSTPAEAWGIFKDAPKYHGANGAPSFAGIPTSQGSEHSSSVLGPLYSMDAQKWPYSAPSGSINREKLRLVQVNIVHVAAYFNACQSQLDVPFLLQLCWHAAWG